MSLYQCDKCGCVENTALGWFHCRFCKNMVAPEYYGQKLCSACGPTHFIDGTVNKKCGKWHGRFERKFYKIGSLETDEHGNIRLKDTKEQV